MAATGLNLLPTELLLQIIWTSYNADLCLTSRTLFARLPSPNALRSDLLMFLFNDWRAAQDDPRLLLLQTCVPLGCLKYVNEETRRGAQRYVLESSWCTLQSLHRAAALVTKTWINHYWDMSDLVPFYHEFLNKALSDVAQTTGVAVCIEHSDQKHRLSVYSPILVQISCTLACGNHGQCGTFNRRSGPLFLLHHVPDRVLQGRDMSYTTRNSHFKFFETCRPRSFTRKWQDWQWSQSIVREQIAAAIYRKQEKALGFLLRLYKIQNDISSTERHDFTELDEAFIPDMVSLAACRGHWKIVEQIIETLHDKELFPKKWFSTTTIAFLKEDSEQRTKKGKCANKMLQKLREKKACACKGIDDVEEAIDQDQPVDGDASQERIERLHHKAPDPLIDIHKLWAEDSQRHQAEVAIPSTE